MHGIKRRTAGNVTPRSRHSRHVPLINARSRHTVPTPVRSRHTPAIEVVQVRRRGMQGEQGEEARLQFAEHDFGPWFDELADRCPRWMRVVLRGATSQPIRVGGIG